MATKGKKVTGEGEGTKADDPKAQQAQAEEQYKKMLVDLKSLGLPQVATGGDLSNWKADLVTISAIKVSKTPDDSISWKTVEGDNAVKIHSLQHRMLVFLAVGSYISPRTDRGFAYLTWLSSHEKVLSKYFSSYTIRVENEKATIPVIQFQVKDVLALAAIHAPILKKSLEIQEPRKTSRNTVVHAEDEEVEFVL